MRYANSSTTACWRRSAKRRRRLGRDLELEPHGVALMIELLDRIRELEAQVRDLHARLPDES